jgi:hypothetical protein
MKEKYVSDYWSPSREDIMYHHLPTGRDGIINYFQFPFNSNLRISFTEAEGCSGRDFCKAHRICRDEFV